MLQSGHVQSDMAVDFQELMDQQLHTLRLGILQAYRRCVTTQSRTDAATHSRTDAVSPHVAEVEEVPPPGVPEETVRLRPAPITARNGCEEDNERTDRTPSHGTTGRTPSHGPATTHEPPPMMAPSTSSMANDRTSHMAHKVSEDSSARISGRTPTGAVSLGRSMDVPVSPLSVSAHVSLGVSMRMSVRTGLSGSSSSLAARSLASTINNTQSVTTQESAFGGDIIRSWESDRNSVYSNRASANMIGGDNEGFSTSKVRFSQADTERRWRASRTRSKNKSTISRVSEVPEEEPRPSAYCEEEDYVGNFVVFPAWSKENETHSKMDALRCKKTGRKSASLQRIQSYQENDDEEIPQSMLLAPFSVGRLTWECFGIIFIAYDTVMIPLQFFDPPEKAFMNTVVWMACIFFSLDVLLNFMTGYITIEGKLVLDFIQVAKHYVKGWFPLDCLLIAIDYLQLLVNDDSVATSAVQIMRVIRVARLLRILRFGHTATGYAKLMSYKVRSEALTIIMRIVKVMFVVIIISHFIACAWYVVGKEGASGKTWLTSTGLDDEALGYRYISSFHWSVTQFVGSADIYPQNPLERTFAVLILLAGFVIVASAVGTITTAMTRLQFIGAYGNEQLTLLNRYLADRHISSHLAARVRHSVLHIMEEEKRNVPESQVQLLLLISEPLRIELHYEVHIPLLVNHPFFAYFDMCDAAATGQICHEAISTLHLGVGDVVFSDGEVFSFPKMYFIASGRLVYYREHRDPTYVGPQQWAAEPVLWTPWAFNGLMKAVTDSTLVCLDSSTFQNIAPKYPGTISYPCEYAAKFVSSLNSISDDDVSDLSNSKVDVEDIAAQVFKEYDETYVTPAQGTSFVSKLAAKVNPSRVSLVSDGSGLFAYATGVMFPNSPGRASAKARASRASAKSRASSGTLGQTVVTSVSG